MRVSLFAQRMRERREALGLSMRALARKMGTTAAQVSRIESGQVSPTLKTMGRVIRALDMAHFEDPSNVAVAGWHYKAEIRRLRAENRRLRKALREIERGWFGYHGRDKDGSRLLECRKTAAAALRPRAKPGTKREGRGR